MSSYTITHLRPWEHLNPKSTYIVMIGIDKAPPHVSFITQSKYYSCSAKGVKNHIDSIPILHALRRKKIPTLFLELKKTIDAQQTKSIYQTYHHLQPSHSCLNPIKKILYSNNLIAFPQSTLYLYNIIESLQPQGYIQASYYLNCESLLSQPTEIQLPRYTQKDIDYQITQYLSK